jgi:hypothetical protein
MSQPRTTALRLIGIVLAAYALLVATHRGEFWPFSIYPMFSQAGTPWTRSLVHEVPDDTSFSWTAKRLGNLPGEPFPVAPRGINQNDVANYVSKTDTWTRKRLQGLRSIFAASYDFRDPLLVMRVRGRLVEDSVAVTATPLILFSDRKTALHPSLNAAVDSSAVRLRSSR